MSDYRKTQIMEDETHRKWLADRKKEKLAEERNRIAKDKVKKREIEAQDKLYLQDKAIRQKEKQHRENIAHKDKQMLFNAEVKARMEKMKHEFETKKALQVQDRKSRSNEYMLREELNHKKMIEAKKEESNQLINYANNIQEKELRHIDFKHGLKNKAYEAKLALKEKYQDFLHKKSLEQQQHDQERFIQAREIANQQQQQVNQFKQEQYLQVQNHNHEIRLKQEERKSYAHKIEVDTQAYLVKSEEDLRTYGERTSIDVQAYIIKSQEDERSFIVKSQEEVRAYEMKSFRDSEAYREKERVDTEEFRERTEIEKDKKHSEIMGMAFKSIVEGEIKKEILWVEAEIKVWLAERLGRDITKEEINEFVKNSSADWDKEV